MAFSASIRIAGALFFLAALSGCGKAQQQAATDPLLVTTSLGPVRGAPAASGNDVRTFLGIPFAAPPIGELRWKPPQSPAKWQAVRDATSATAGCIQAAGGAGMLPWTAEFLHTGPISEDCLYLNVWSPANLANHPRPVLFFIYGGGFVDGSINAPLYDGAALARKGVVVVTANYRTGAPGFLVLAELSVESRHGASGNYGLMDQVAALQWVRDNIAAFGGDPHSVTIAGQSAGAISVSLLIRSPQATGLFHRAIMASGPGALDAMDPRASRLAGPRAEAEQNGLRYLKQAGASSLKELRLVEGNRLPLPGTPDPRSQGVQFWPVADGWFVPVDANGALAAGQANDVPILLGMMADESSMAPGYEATRDKSRAAGVEGLRRVLSVHAASSRQPAYVYYFQHPIPWPEHPQFGAFHSAELPYIFDNLSLLNRPWTAQDHALAAAASASWVNFATTGKPGGGAVPTWPAYVPDAPEWMVFGGQPQLQKSPLP